MSETPTLYAVERAARKVLAGLEARIDEAPRHAVPVFDGIAELAAALNRLDALRAPEVPSGSGEPWTPTSENINTLPEPVRSYIHNLEARCDPAGDVRTIAVLRNTIGLLEELALERWSEGYRAAVDLLDQWGEHQAREVLERQFANALPFATPPVTGEPR